MSDVTGARVYMTTDDEREAHAIAERLWLERRRRAVVVRVRELPESPRTSDRYCILVREEE